jgi:hypothetical protein
MTPRARLRESASAGFVLVGVVIMVLALTILGLSLFSLSNYEAQFMQRSLERQQALESALGGLDRARYAVVATDSMLLVTSGLPLENVFYAKATQLQGAVVDSAHAVIWGGNPIHIQVAARCGSATRWAEGDYIPRQTINWYSRLMTVAGGSQPIQIPTVDQNSVARVKAGLSDSIWQAGNDTSWLGGVIVPPPYLRSVPIPVPSAFSFIAAHSAISTTPPPAANLMFLAPPDGAPTYWYTDTHLTGFSYWDATDGVAADHQIHVTGRVVWCLPNGVRFEKPVEVFSDGDPNACLVIVARDGYDGQPGGTYMDHHGAIWFFSGLISHQVPVILVSDGIVKLEAGNQTGATTNIANLSIFASQVFLMGPTTSPPVGAMSLSYGGGAVLKGQLDFLFSFGALPNSSAPSSQQLTLYPGTWRITQ